ncbi:unnamed protein product, partial [Ceratitis capitata]
MVRLAIAEYGVGSISLLEETVGNAVAYKEVVKHFVVPTIEDPSKNTQNGHFSGRFSILSSGSF